jgi:hypothetical protein
VSWWHAEGSVSKADAVSEWKGRGSKLAGPAATSDLREGGAKPMAQAGQTLNEMPNKLVGAVPAAPSDSSKVGSGAGSLSGGLPSAGDGPGWGLISKLRRRGDVGGSSWGPWRRVHR